MVFTFWVMIHQIEQYFLEDYWTIFRIVNSSNAETTFVQSAITEIFLKTILTLACWYSFGSSSRALSV